jgi:hypothetical protein
LAGGLDSSSGAPGPGFNPQHSKNKKKKKLENSKEKLREKKPIILPLD